MQLWNLQEIRCTQKLFSEVTQTQNGTFPLIVIAYILISVYVYVYMCRVVTVHEIRKAENGGWGKNKEGQ